MSNISTPENPRKEGFEPCPDPWAKLHVFYNPATGQAIPARCKRWSCFQCAKINYYKLDYLISAGEPERFITLTRAGKTTEEIRINLQKLVQGLRRLGKKFEYLSVVELHLNEQPHLHMMQRGDFVEQELLSELWERYTAKSYSGQGSFIVDIRRIDPNQNVKGYLLKYIKKSWEAEKIGPKSWQHMQSLFPGLNHYRYSRNWLLDRPEKVENWQILPKVLVDIAGRPLDPVDEIFYTDTVGPLTPVQALAPNYRERARKLAKGKKAEPRSVPPARPGRAQSKV
jgi:hypothetical protein